MALPATRSERACTTLPCRQHGDVGGAAADVDHHEAPPARRSAARRPARPPPAPRSDRPCARRPTRPSRRRRAARPAWRRAGTQMRMRGRRKPSMVLARWMNWRSISSVAMKSAMTPSRMGRTSSTGSGARPMHGLGLEADGQHFARCRRASCTATTDGSSMMMPRPTTCTSVFAVPRSIAMSSENALATPSRIACPHLLRRAPSLRPSRAVAQIYRVSAVDANPRGGRVAASELQRRLSSPAAKAPAAARGRSFAASPAAC